MKNLIILISFSLLMITAPAQVVYFPACEDLMVTKMQFDHGKDTLYVTVYNDCDTCDMAVYTGIIVYRGEFIDLSTVEDTLAIDKKWSTELTPDNNAERTYTVIVKKDFVLSQKNFKVGLLGICDSIPLAPDIIMGLNSGIDKENKKKVFLQSNSILIAEPGQSIKDVSVYNLSGQLMKKDTGIFSSNYVLKQNKPGIYIVSVKLTSNEVVNLKYVNTTK
jgi:hypothetical protein